jgi:hypothetical protein
MLFVKKIVIVIVIVTADAQLIISSKRSRRIGKALHCSEAQEGNHIYRSIHSLCIARTYKHKNNA